MWNVYQYCKDYANNKVSDKEFKDIYIKQEPLKNFIKDMYLDIDKNHKNDQYLKLGGIKFPYSSFTDIDSFVINCNDEQFKRLIIKALITVCDEIYKNN